MDLAPVDGQGPTLATVNTLPYTQASAGRGAVLAAAYCLGPAVMRTGGALLIVLAILLLTGWWDALMIWLRAWLGATGLGTSVV